MTQVLADSTAALTQGVLKVMSLVPNVKPVTAVLLAAGLLIASASWRVVLAQPATDAVKLNADTFGPIHQQIRPQPGESRWMEIPWLTDLHAARQKAAAEGKPLFLMAAGKAISIGMC